MCALHLSLFIIVIIVLNIFVIYYLLLIKIYMKHFLVGKQYNCLSAAPLKLIT